jgi:glycosyltransferase involved in cell wall biosynthesis
MLVVVVGPSAELISGSLLRPINIYYSLKDFKSLKVDYIPVRGIPDLMLQLKRILSANVIIASGVNPWISALIAVMGRALRRKVIVDFHGFAWLEVSVTNATVLPVKMLLLASEKISYKLPHYVTTASPWLSNTLAQYFGRRGNVITIENSVSYIFEKTVHRMVKNYDTNILRKYVCEKILKRKCLNKPILIAPLPSVFKSNILAYKELQRLKNLMNKDVIVIVTGIKEANDLSPQDNIIPVGYISYTSYVALLLSADGVILPYPSNAICGGVRNKVLEAGFCKKPIISTKTGMMYFKALPTAHYISIDAILKSEKVKSLECHIEHWKFIAEKFYVVIVNQYSFQTFRHSFLTFIKSILINDIKT